MTSINDYNIVMGDRANLSLSARGLVQIWMNLSGNKSGLPQIVQMSLTRELLEAKS